VNDAAIYNLVKTLAKDSPEWREILERAAEEAATQRICAVLNSKTYKKRLA